MIPFQHILFPTDFSSNAHFAQEYACEFADRFNAKLHVLSVVQDVSLVLPETGLFLTVPLPGIQEIISAAEGALRDQLDPQWTSTHQVTLQIAVGTPYAEIVRYAQDHQIDLIVMGTQGRTGLKHVLLGSVAERVLRQAHCPVMTVRSPSGTDDSAEEMASHSG